MNEINFLLVEAVVKNYLHFQIVESPDFQKLAHKLNGAYKVLHYKTFQYADAQDVQYHKGESEA
jgi:tRNA A37 threonylcarbamoyladenosine biosynthesis protein TsaE